METFSSFPDVPEEDLETILRNQIIKTTKKRKLTVIRLYYMASSCSRYNASPDWLIVGHYSPIMPTGRLQACKHKAKNHKIINNLLTLNVRSLRENLQLRPSRIDLATREF